LADRHAFTQCAGIHAASGQFFEDAAPGGIRQRFEEVIFIHDYTLVVTYLMRKFSAENNHAHAKERA
jgi:hypothetical protein